jgi:hypothetical protein
MWADNFSAATAAGQRPTLNLQLSGVSNVLTWPQSALNYKPQQSPTMASNSWTFSSQPVMLSNNVCSVSAPATNKAGFYRLSN